MPEGPQETDKLNSSASVGTSELLVTGEVPKPIGGKWFSPLRMAIDRKMPLKGTPDLVLGITKSSGVSPEECRWIKTKENESFDQWIKNQGKRLLSKVEILSFIDQAVYPIQEVDSQIDHTLKHTPDLPNWAFDGGRNYREILLIDPSALAKGFKDYHFEIPGVFVWIRTKEYDDTSGKRVVCAEVIQQGTFVKDLNIETPYSKNYQEIAVKRLISLASELPSDSSGRLVEKIVWPTGAQQGERNNLVRYNDIVYDEKSKKLVMKSLKSSDETEWEDINNEKLAKLIGGFNAKKLLDSPLSEDGVRVLKNIAIGAKHLQLLYDEKIPEFINRYCGRWNVRSSDTQIITGKKGETKTTVHSLDITPKMKKEVLEKGQPLFGAYWG